MSSGADRQMCDRSEAIASARNMVEAGSLMSTNLSRNRPPRRSPKRIGEARQS